MAEQKLPDKAQENEMKREKVRVVPIKYIDDSPDHPFQVRDDEEMMSLVESIATFGVITPIIARKTADERYELISGHRRKRACELLHIDTLPIIVRDLSREEGIILMVDSNLQREHILPSEKAFAYKMKMDALRRTAGRPSKDNSVPVAQNLGKTTREVVAEESGESQDQIRRYVRLTELIPQLLQMVDEGKIAFRPAVELPELVFSRQTVPGCVLWHRRSYTRQWPHAKRLHPGMFSGSTSHFLQYPRSFRLGRCQCSAQCGTSIDAYPACFPI